ncbi:hypothetical protein F2P81_022465 [Scophthalmus maximus]|uniref:Uncharacterized protein n=1 Tax=Scophthalmus maximus TaxID=52904 RepID=A0A6A4S4Z2_SCOMX|nr:hypothetical protein F2P81_022465 [Scophthalmus maximus]
MNPHLVNIHDGEKEKSVIPGRVAETQTSPPHWQSSEFLTEISLSPPYDVSGPTRFRGLTAAQKSVASVCVSEIRRGRRHALERVQQKVISNLESIPRDANIRRQTAGFAFCSARRKHKQAYGCNTVRLNMLQQASSAAKQNNINNQAVCIKRRIFNYDNSHGQFRVLIARREQNADINSEEVKAKSMCPSSNDARRSNVIASCHLSGPASDCLFHRFLIRATDKASAILSNDRR